MPPSFGKSTRSVVSFSVIKKFVLHTTAFYYEALRNKGLAICKLLQYLSVLLGV